jgi:hypothetical protein
MKHTLIVVALVSRSAFAGPDVTDAESLFREGRRLMEAGQLAAACDAFEASERAAAAPTTELNLADCREKNHQLASAWGLFVDVERQLRGATDATSTALVTSAHTHAGAIEPRLSKLTIKVGASLPQGFTLTRGDTAIEVGAWNRELPIDGGTYKIVARAPGYVDWSTSVVVKPESDAKTIEVPALAAISPARSYRAPIAFGVAAVVLGGTALGFELWAEHTYDNAKTDDHVTSQLSTWHSANTRRYLAEGVGVGALACAVTAVIVLVRDPVASEKPGLALAPIATPTELGFAAIARW